MMKKTKYIINSLLDICQMFVRWFRYLKNQINNINLSNIYSKIN